MYFDIHRFRWLPAALVAVPVLLVATVVTIVSSMGSSTPSTVPTVVTTLHGHLPTTTLSRGPQVSLPIVSPRSENLAARKAAVIAGEANQMSRGTSVFAVNFLKNANKGASPHYRVITTLGAYPHHPDVVKVAVLGTTQVICLQLSTMQFSPLPAADVMCP